MAHQQPSIINNTDQPPSGNTFFQSPVHRRFILFLLNVPNDTPFIEVTVRMAVLGHHHGLPISRQHINIGISAFQIPHKWQGVRHLQQNPHILITKIRKSPDQINHLPVDIVTNQLRFQRKLLFH